MLFIFLVLIICLKKFLWKVSILVCSFFESVHNSELYRKMEPIRALKILSLVESVILFEQSTFLFLLKAAHASCFLLLMYSLIPSRLPRYLQFFHFWSDVLLISYSSVLSAFTIRFLSVSIWGTVCFISSVAFWLVVILEMSSAYC